MEPYLFFLHWAHLLSGVIWIGTLYFFNFFLTPFLEKTQAGVQTEIVHKLVPRSLPGFWLGGLVTFLTGSLIYVHRLAATGGAVFFTWPYGLAISVGALMGTLMFLNGWLVMYPRQKVVIASAERMAQGGKPIPEAGVCARRVILASRTNTLLSIPTLFFMGAASHYPSMAVKDADASLTWFWIIILVIMGAIEINAITGMHGATKKPLESISGTLWGGFILTAVLYLLFQILL